MERVITADDVIRAGACRSGVYEWLEGFDPPLPAAMPIASVLRKCSDEDRNYVLAIDGNGNGNGNGYGYGNGNGNGNGNGDGYGDGYG